MRRSWSLSLGCIVLVLAWSSDLRAEENGCVSCHADESMEPPLREIARRFLGGAHRRAGLSCEVCHGGRPDTSNFMDAHRRKDGFKGKIPEADIVPLCVGCHDDPDRMEALGAPRKDLHPGRDFLEGVHGRVTPVEGFETPNCVSCHGAHGIDGPGGPDSTVHPSRVPMTCRRCHGDLTYMRAFTSASVRADQYLEYMTSGHARRLAVGDTKVAVCSSCHGSHKILPAGNPNSGVHPTHVARTCGRCHSDREYMKGYRVRGPNDTVRPMPTNQQADYETSVHHEILTEAGDLSAPTCNDCHGNHGATPPEVRTVANVCAQCHTRPAELFFESELRKELDSLGFAQCAVCHDHHAIHRPDDRLLAALAEGRTVSGWVPGENWQRLAGSFAGAIEKLETRIDTVEQLVARTEGYGMDVTRARLRLDEARSHLVEARVTIHTFARDRMAEIVDGVNGEPGGLAHVAEAEAFAHEALEERTRRRVGLALSLVVIIALMVGLGLRIRRMEQVQPASPVH